VIVILFVVCCTFGQYVGMVNSLLEWVPDPLSPSLAIKRPPRKDILGTNT
jgi:hypothetical protein